MPRFVLRKAALAQRRGVPDFLVARPEVGRGDELDVAIFRQGAVQIEVAQLAAAGGRRESGEKIDRNEPRAARSSARHRCGRLKLLSRGRRLVAPAAVEPPNPCLARRPVPKTRSSPKKLPRAFRRPPALGPARGCAARARAWRAGSDI